MGVRADHPIPVVKMLRTVAAGMEIATGNETAGHASEFNQVAFDENLFLVVHNTAAATPRTFKVLQTAVQADGATLTEASFSVAATKTFVWGPVPQALYRQADGFVYINPDHAELHFQAFSLK